jgi:hypothetical protein
MERNPDFDAHLAAMHRHHVDLLEQMRLSEEAIEGSKELLRRIDDELAKSPLKP